MPPQALGTPDAGALGALTVARLAHRLGTRGADGAHRLPFEMARGAFHLAQLQSGGSGRLLRWRWAGALDQHLVCAAAEHLADILWLTAAEVPPQLRGGNQGVGRDRRGRAGRMDVPRC